MATRPRSYGLTAEVQNKIKLKYNKDSEAECLKWISEVRKSFEPFLYYIFSLTFFQVTFYMQF